MSGPAGRREGRDSFEPRLVFASPCVPRTSYFNETVCLSLSLSLSLSPPPRSFPLANRPTGPLARSRLAPSLSFSLSLSTFFLSPSRSRVLPYHAFLSSLSSSLPSVPSTRLLKKASRHLRVWRTAWWFSAWSMKNLIMSIRTIFSIDKSFVYVRRSRTQFHRKLANDDDSSRARWTT